MKNWSFILIFLTLITPIFNVHSRTEYVDWAKSDINVSPVKLDSLRFTNRSRCALDSKKPTDSAFVLINNTEVAKGLYRMAKMQGNDKSLVKTGIQVYRYSVVQMLKYIHSNLMNKKLPLLPSDTTGKYVPNKYRSIVQKCRSDQYCNGLDQYIQNIWDVFHDDKNYSKIDNFHQKKNFIYKRVFNNKDVPSELTCHYLKKFSPLQAHLYGTKPTADLFSQMAKVMANKDEYITSCEDFEAQDNLVVAPFQINITGLNERYWNKYGFDYWNSLKLYFSWAWRKAPEMNQMAHPFGNLFKSVILEESVLFTPNGCKSMTPAKCDQKYLAENHLREFAKEDFKFSDKYLDSLKDLPKGPQDDILEDLFTNVNTDILDLGTKKTAVEWLKGYNKNITKTRGLMKKKLLTSINAMNAITKISVPNLVQEIKNELSPLFAEGMEGENQNELKNKLYYLCGEVYQANHKYLNQFKNDLEVLKEVDLVDSLAGEMSHNKTSENFKYYETLNNEVQKLCDSFDQNSIFEADDFTLDKTGFSKWFSNLVYEGKVESRSEEINKEELTRKVPYLTYNLFASTQNYNDVVCVDPIHCARKVISSMIKFYSLSQYGHTVWAADGKIKSPSLFNPYAERTACKAYDPWFKTKSLVFDLFNSVGQAAMSAFVPGAVFLNMSLQPGKVTSFRKLVKEGKIEYDVRRKKTKVQLDLITDFGPLLGVPCSVSINNYGVANPYERYQFAGISVGACYERNSGSIVANSGSDIDESGARNLSVCGQCTLNFESVLNVGTAISSFTSFMGPGTQFVGSALYLLKGALSVYKHLKDKDNIPHDWKANPNYVLQTYRRFGEIPEKCEKPLRKGKRCLGSWKERWTSEVINKFIKTPIKSIKANFFKVTAYAKVHGCDGEIKVNLRNFKRSYINVPENCQHLLIDDGPEEGVWELNKEELNDLEALNNDVIERERAAVRARAIERERIEAERLRLEEEERARLGEENRIRLEEEAKIRLLEEEAERLRLEEAVRAERLEEVERIRIEKEYKLKLEEEARVRRIKEEERKRKLEEEARIRRIEEARKKKEMLKNNYYQSLCSVKDHSAKYYFLTFRNSILSEKVRRSGFNFIEKISYDEYLEKEIPTLSFYLRKTKFNKLKIKVNDQNGRPQPFNLSKCQIVGRE